MSVAAVVQLTNKFQLKGTAGTKKPRRRSLTPIAVFRVENEKVLDDYFKVTGPHRIGLKLRRVLRVLDASCATRSLN